MKRFIVWLTGLLIFLSVNFAQAADLPEKQEVVAEGISAITGNVNTAKEAAVAQALRNAVEQAVGVYVLSETKVSKYQVLSDEIYTKATGFVSNWEVLEEKQDNNNYKVKVKVIVGLEPLTDELKKLGVLKSWKTAVLLTSAIDGLSNLSPTGTAINKIVEDTGFYVASPEILTALENPAISHQVVKGNYQNAIQILRDNHIDLLIVGKISGDIACKKDESYGVPIEMCSVNGRLDAYVVRSDTAETIIMQSFTTKSAGNGKEKVQATVLEDLGTQAGKYFTKQMLRIPASVTVNLAFVISVADFKRASQFKDTLAKISSIKRITDSGFIKGKMTYDVEAEGNASLLCKLLTEDKSFAGFKVSIISCTSGKVEISIK